MIQFIEGMIMKNVVKLFDSIDDLSEYFVSLLLGKISKIKSNEHFIWFLSGGNTPKSIFSKIVKDLRDSVEWTKVKVFWGDERCVGPEHKDSNYKMAREYLLDHISIPSANIFRIWGENNPFDELVRYSELAMQHIPQKLGRPIADLIMLGIGEDGHTASIFPENLNPFKSKNLFEVTENTLTKQKRITATGKIINNAKAVIMLAPGEIKASKAAQIINHMEGWELLPASLVKPKNGKLIWLLDRQIDHGF